jgi:glycosyltransferase involved in cell wall biosynthesis
MPLCLITIAPGCLCQRCRDRHGQHLVGAGRNAISSVEKGYPGGCFAERDMKFPTIAAVITNYNYARFLPYALDSVLAQTSPFDEIIVVDDGSTDNSLEVLAQYDSRIKVISIANGGQTGAARAGIIASTSDYIYTLDADDFADPQLVRVVKLCLADKRPVKVQFQLRGVGAEGELIGSTFPTFPVKYDRPEMLQDNKSYGFYISPPTSGNVFSREALERLGFRSFDSRGAFDGSASLAMPYLGEIMTLNEPLAHYRVHGNNGWSWDTPTIALLQREIRIFKEIWGEVVAALNFDKPPFTDRPLYIDERRMMIACKQNKTFIGPEVWRFVSGLPSTNFPPKEKIILAMWAMCLLIPSASLRDYSIRMKRSSANRSRRLQALLNLVMRS